jgi:hypothetical protein
MYDCSLLGLACVSKISGPQRALRRGSNNLKAIFAALSIMNTGNAVKAPHRGGAASLRALQLAI